MLLTHLLSKSNFHDDEKHNTRFKRMADRCGQHAYLSFTRRAHGRPQRSRSLRRPCMFILFVILMFFIFLDCSFQAWLSMKSQKIRNCLEQGLIFWNFFKKFRPWLNSGVFLASTWGAFKILIFEILKFYLISKISIFYILKITSAERPIEWYYFSNILKSLSAERPIEGYCLCFFKIF